MSSYGQTMNANSDEGNSKASGKKEEKRIPRPPNAFMIFGQQHRKILAHQYPEFTNKQISKILGNEWRNMSHEDKGYFHKLADEAYAKHMKKYPGYYYSPLEARQRKAERKRKYLQKCGRRGASQNTEADCSENVTAVEALPREANVIDAAEIPKELTQELEEIQQGQYMRQLIHHNGQLIPVYCHHSVYHEINNPNGSQTLLSISLSPIEVPQALYIAQPGRPEKKLVKAGSYAKESANFVPDEMLTPSIYHVSSNDPSLALVDDTSEHSNSFEENDPEANSSSSVTQDLSDLMSSYLPPMDNPAVSITPVNSGGEYGQFRPECSTSDRRIRVDNGNQGSDSSSKTRCSPRVIVKKEPQEDSASPFILSTVIDVMSAE